jgi:hypothetical protein
MSTPDMFAWPPLVEMLMAPSVTVLRNGPSLFHVPGLPLL